METKILTAAVLATVALIAPVQAGNGHHNGGGGNVVSGRSGAVRGGGPSFGSMPARSFGGNRMVYSGQRFSSFGTRSPNVTRFRPQSVNSNFGARQLARQNFDANRFNQFGNNSRIARTGNGFARNNGAIRNQRTGSGQIRNGNLAGNWKNHVFAQRSANWNRNWNRHADHWWHGHRCHFFNGSWVIFDIGFYPWGPWGWDYPYYGYGYGYPYNYGYGYNDNYGNGYDYGYNDPGVYDSQPANQNGYDDQSGYQNSSGDQSANSAVAGAQDRLTREGFYRGQIDGVLGPETRHAIVRFQTKHGLRISGELTTETLAAMGLRQNGNYGSN